MTPAPSALNRTIREVAAQTMSSARIPGMSIAVVNRAGALLETGYGRSDIANDAAATPETRYRWFSMTKLVTATAAVQLSDQGRLDLESPVHEHLESWPSGNAATVGQLLSHTAGLPNPLPIKWVRPIHSARPDQAAMLDRLLQRHGAASKRAGGPAKYSNIGYLAAAEIIARTTGKSFEEHVTDELLTPLGMTATAFDHPSTEAATGYLNVPRPVVPLLKALLPAGLVGDHHSGVHALRPFYVDGAGYGGLIGPVTDAGRSLQLHLRGGELDGVRILTPKSAQKMQELVSRGRPFDHATGWFRARNGGDSANHWEHYGTGAGYWNIARIYPDRGVGVVIMTNSTRKFDFDSIMTSITKELRS